MDGTDRRLEPAKRLSADVTVNYHTVDAVAAIIELTGGRGVDVAVEALGTPRTLESCLRVLLPGGVLSSLGVY